MLSIYKIVILSKGEHRQPKKLADRCNFFFYFILYNHTAFSCLIMEFDTTIFYKSFWLQYPNKKVPCLVYWVYITLPYL